MTRPASNIRAALKIVRTLGLAPLARSNCARPKNYLGGGYATWNVARREVEAQVSASLTSEGVAVSALSDGRVKVRFAGIKASSTSGLEMALKNWVGGATRRLFMDKKGSKNG